MYGNKKELNPILRAACILLAFLTMPAAADLAGDKLSQQFASQADQRNNNAYNEQQINGNGREQKATSAQDKSGSGQTMAAVTGAALIATGSSMVPSIIPSVSAAGAELIAKGVQELAQAAADGAAKDKNGQQKDMLLAQVDGTSPTAGLSGNMSLPPDLQNLLQQHGVNPDSFAQAASAGQIQNGNDVLKAMGLPQVSGDELAAAQNLANQKLQSTLAQASPGTPLSAITSMDENARPAGPSVDGGEGGGGSGLLSENTHGAEKSEAGAASDPTGGGSSVAADGGAAAGGPAGSSAGNGGGLQGLMAGFGLGGLLGGEDGVSAVEKMQASKKLLLSLGVLPPQPKQNIFQMGHRNYRSFQKWRQMRRVAQK